MLKDTGCGCYVGNTFMGAIGYVDDVALLSPSVMALKKMLHVCDLFGIDYNVSFNVDKYQLIHYGRDLKEKHQFTGLLYNNTFIKCTEAACHLGNIIGTDQSKIYDKVINNFITCFNGINAMFKKAYVNVKYHLFKSYCMNLYGSLFWDLGSNATKNFYIVWRKCVRKLLGLPYSTHCSYLPQLVNDKKFICHLATSRNQCVMVCYQLRRNAKCIGNIIDLLLLRDTGCSELSRAEIDYMISFLCTH